MAELRIFNPDGSEAELSGNGARQAALYLRRAGWTDEDEFSILTKAGEIRPTITSPDTATLAMGRASRDLAGLSLRRLRWRRRADRGRAPSGASSTSRSATPSA